MIVLLLVFCVVMAVVLTAKKTVVDTENRFDAVVISLLPKRGEDLEQYLKECPVEDVKIIRAVKGRLEDVDKAEISSQLKRTFRQNPHLVGNLGCLESHKIALRGVTGMRLITEDDVSFVSDFKSKVATLLEALEKVDPEWDLFLLGWACAYRHYPECHENDDVERYDGFVRVKYFCGGWGYLVRNREVAQKILSGLKYTNTVYDLNLAERAKAGELKVYGACPTLIRHPGRLMIDSLDYVDVSDRSYRSDNLFEP